MRALTLSISNKVEVHIQSGWFESSVSEYHSGLKTAPLCCTSEARTNHAYQHVTYAVTRGCKEAANRKILCEVVGWSVTVNLGTTLKLY